MENVWMEKTKQKKKKSKAILSNTFVCVFWEERGREWRAGGE